MTESSKARALGFNHIALEVGDVDEALEFYAKFIDFELRGRHEAFTDTGLKILLDEAGNRDLIIIGFMTHMCVSSTARVALDHGFRLTIDAESCATRDLPDGSSGVLDTATLHKVALTELSDRFASIARNHEW